MDFVREYGAILVALVFPFTPHAARRAGYGGASQDIFRALDRLDTGLPGGARGWSERWFNRPRGRRDNCPRGLFPLDGKGGGVGVAATAVVLAAGVCARLHISRHQYRLEIAVLLSYITIIEESLHLNFNLSW